MFLLLPLSLICFILLVRDVHLVGAPGRVDTVLLIQLQVRVLIGLIVCSQVIDLRLFLSVERSAVASFPLMR